MPINEYDELLSDMEQAPPANPYLSVLDSLEDEKARKLRSATVQAHDRTPDRAAEVRRLSSLSGLAPDVVDRNFDDLSKRLAVEGKPYAQMMRETPALAEWASDPNNQAIATDDMEQLGLLEWLVTAPQRAFAQGIHQTRVGELRTKQLLGGELSREDRDRLNAEKYAMEAGGELGAGESWFAGALTGGSRLLANVLGAMATAGPKAALGAGVGALIGGGGGLLATGGPGVVPGAVAGGKFGLGVGATLGAAQFGFELEAGLAYDEFLELKDENGQVIDPEAARAAALVVGGLNAGLEVVGLGVLARSLPGLNKLKGAVARDAVKEALANPTTRAALAQLVRGYGKTLTGETAVEVAQRAVTVFAGEYGKIASGRLDVTLSYTEIAEELAREGAGALQGFAFLSVPGPVLSFARDVARAERADQSAAWFAALAEGATQSKTIQQFPEAAQTLLAQATKDGPIEHVYAPVTTFNQYWEEQGLDPVKVAAELTGDPTAHETATRTGADLKIPTATYAVRMAGTEHHAFFAQELRTGVDEMNLRERKDFETQLEAQATAVMEASAAAPTTRIFESVRQQLETAGYTADAAVKPAALWTSIIGTVAQRAGVDPTTLYERYGLRITRPDLAQPIVAPVASAVPAVADDSGRGVLGPGGYAGPERREAAGAPPEGVERRRPLDLDAPIDASDTVAAATRMLEEDPAIARKAAELEARARRGKAGGPAVDLLKDDAALTDEDVAGAADDATSFDPTEFNQLVEPLTPEALQAWAADVMERFGEDLTVFDVHLTNQGDLNLSMIAVAAGAQRTGTGTAVMRELSRFADAHRLRITLSPALGVEDEGALRDDRLGTTSRSRLVTFYKRFGFVENAGRHKDFSIDDAMYREPTAKVTELGQPTQAPIFYSVLEQAIESRMPNRASAEQILAIARNPQSGIKPDELKWSGLEDWLAGQQTVTKEDVLDFLQANRIEIKETLIGDFAAEDEAQFQRRQQAQSRVETAESALMKFLQEEQLFTFNGAIDYALDTARASLSESQFEAARANPQQWALMSELREAYNEREWEGTPDKTREPRYGKYTLPGGMNYRELLLMFPNPPTHWINGTPITAEDMADPITRAAAERVGSTDRADFISSHWQNDPNVLAHVRFNTRFDQNGRRVLFIEELQSDWHQRGRKEGYQSRTARRSVEAIDKDIDAVNDQLKERAPNAENFGEFHAAWSDNPDLFAEHERLMQERNDVVGNNLVYGGGVPDAPFKTSWPELVIKRMIRYAAEQDFEAVAWAPGQVQADRYDLSKQVGSIDYRRTWYGLGTENAREVFEMGVTDLEGEHIALPKDAYTAPELEGVVGKEIAEKIIRGEGQSSGGRMTLRGVDLKVGGEGMRGFYDQILPKTVNKIVKRWGVKVEDLHLDDTTQALANNSTAEGAANGAIPVHSITVTDEMRASVLETGQTLFAPDRRGSIRFGADRQMLITLYEKANLATFLHESGHFFLELLTDLADAVAATPQAARTEQQQQLLGDWRAIREWLVDEDHTGSGFSEKQHEQFARGFEAYLMEGRAPSLELRSAFASFRAWLIGIYKNLSSLNVRLTPEVRRVFDRMVASDDAIAEAEAAGRVEPMFSTPEDAGMSAADFALYRGRIEQASTAAREDLERKLLAEIHREQERAWQDARSVIEGQVIEQLAQQPVYRALFAMQRGTTPTGESLFTGETPEPWKLSKTMLVDRVGADRLRRLPRPFLYAREGGLDPDVVAETFGFDSGDAMLVAIEQAEPWRSAVQRETDRRMLADHGSMLLDGSLQEEARAAVASEFREDVIRTELRALANLRRTVTPFVQAEREKGREAVRAERDKTAGVRAELSAVKARARGGAVTIRAALPPDDVVREAARTQIARTTIRDLKPERFWTAARRASQRATEAAARQEFDEAIAAKQQELLNIALHREAVRANEDVEARVRRARDLAKPAARQRLAKAGEAYLDQVDGILDRYEFARVSQKALDRRASLRKFVAALEGEGLPIDLPEELLEEHRRVNYQELTVEALIGVTDGLQQLVHLARLKNRLLANKQERDLEAAAGTLTASIQEHARGKVRTAARDRRPSEERRRTVGDFFAGHRKLASLLREMDGFEDGGAAWSAIMRPLNEAGGREAEMNADATRRFAAIIERAFPGAEKRRLYTKTLVPSIGRSLSRMERIAVALNWGNDGNRDRIRRAEGWTDDQVQGILDSLTTADLAFVQSVFDFLDSYWPEIEAKQQRVYGVAPEKVERVEIRAAAGTIAGGYYPLKYDDRLSASAIGHLDLEAANLAKQAAYAHATTKRGHTKARVETVKMPIRLDFGPMFEHVQQVIHDLTHHEALLDVARLLGHRDVQQAILDHHGDLVYKQIRNTIRDVAFGDVPATNGVERAFNHVRMGATIAGLGWNLTTALLQPLGLANSVVRIGPKWVARGIARWIRSPTTMIETVHWIEESSAFMRSRSRTLQREINEIRNKVGVETGSMKGWIDDALRGSTADVVTRQGIADSFFWLIQQAQRLADIPTWLGAYEKAMANRETEARAIALADQAVLDSQGGGQTKDLAQIQRGGPMLRLWTNFYSYFNVVYNQASESRRRTHFRKPAEVGRLAADYLMLFIVPATLGFVIRETMRGGDDDDDELVERLIAENVGYLMGTMLGMREISGVVAGGYGYEGPAGARAFAALGRLGQQVQQGELDQALIRSLNDAAGVLFHYPAGQVWRTSNGIAALAEGKTENPGVVVTGPPRR